jgi:hypothetical protein
MLKRTEEYGRVFIAAIVITLTAPAVSIGSDLGHDWYCPDPATHAQYTKHLKLHLDHGSEAITNVLDKIYSDSSLSAEQKHAKTLDILNKELAKAKIGPGVGD